VLSLVNVIPASLLVLSSLGRLPILKFCSNNNSVIMANHRVYAHLTVLFHFANSEI